MNILMVYQSVVDMGASFFSLVYAFIKVYGIRLSKKSSYDQFVCNIWLTKQPLWYFIHTSTYGILLTALDRYAAVMYPNWYNNHVRTTSMFIVLVQCFSNCLKISFVVVNFVNKIMCKLRLELRRVPIKSAYATSY